MTRTFQRPGTTVARIAARLAVLSGAIALTACASMNMGGGERLTLSGANEVPAVVTPATGTGTISVTGDRSVSGSVTVTGMTPTMGHIHQGAPGVNGPVIVPLTQNGNVFSVPAGSKLTEAQYDAYKKGNLYVNIHSAANPGGQVRAQLKGS